MTRLELDSVKKYLRIEDEFDEDDAIIEVCMLSARSYIEDYTNIKIETTLDYRGNNAYNLEDNLVIAFLLLVSDFYSRRLAVGGYETSKINFILKSTLEMNRQWL